MDGVEACGSYYQDGLLQLYHFVFSCYFCLFKYLAISLCVLVRCLNYARMLSLIYYINIKLCISRPHTKDCIIVEIKYIT